MTQKDLKYLVAESIGAQSGNKELVFRILTKKIANQLQQGEAVRIKNIGTFSKPKEEELLSENKLVFVPVGGESDHAVNSLFTNIPIASQNESDGFTAENIFEIGVSKSFASIRSPGDQEAETLSLKEIEKRVDELLTSSEKIEDYSVWSKSIEEIAADESSTEDNIFEEAEPDIGGESLSGEGVLGVSSYAAENINDLDGSLDLPDFDSMEKDFISEIKSSESDERIDIVSEDDIIVPGENRIDEEINEETDKTSEKMDEEIDDAPIFDEDEEIEDEEDLEGIFNEFKTENSQDNLDQNLEKPSEEQFDESTSDESTIDEEIKALGIEETDANDEITEENELEELALETEDSGELEKPEEFNQAKIEDVLEEESAELDELFEDAEEKISSTNIEEFESDEGNAAGTERVLDELETDLESLDEDFDLTKGEYEIEHPDFEKEGIETVSASIEEIEESDFEQDDSEKEELASESKRDDDFAEENVSEEDLITENDDSTSELNELPDGDDKQLESEMDESEYSNLSSGSDQGKGVLGKGFWISVMIFVAVVVVGAYLYLFVYDSDDKGTVMDDDKKNEQPVISDAHPTEVVKQEQEVKEPVKQTVPKKREVVRIQGKGNTGLYRDGVGERLVSNTIFERDGAYSVQVSSFKTQSVAEKDARRIQKLGHEAFIVKAFVRKLNAEYYRVRVGYFNTQKQAEEFAASFKR